MAAYHPMTAIADRENVKKFTWKTRTDRQPVGLSGVEVEFVVFRDQTVVFRCSVGNGVVVDDQLGLMTVTMSVQNTAGLVGQRLTYGLNVRPYGSGWRTLVTGPIAFGLVGG